MFKRMSLLGAGLAAVVMGGSAMAGSVNTGVAFNDWQVGGGSAVDATVNSSWVPAPAGSEWITVDTPFEPNQGSPAFYTYTLDLDFITGPNTFLLEGIYSSDNIVTDIAVDGSTLAGFVAPVLPVVLPEPRQYETIVPMSFTFNADAGSVLSFTVWNEDLTNNFNPSGLLVSGNVSVVPTPTAALAGLIGLGGLALRRRKLA